MGRGWVNAIREAQGAAKGKLFTKIAKEITVATRLGGASPDSNARLRAALRDAQKNSVPKDTVERAIKRGAGPSADGELEEIVYEGFGPHKVACVVEAVTDNRNRTAQDIRSIFSRLGAGLGASGSVMWMFDHVGLIIARPPSGGMDPEEAAIHAEANEVEQGDDGASLFYGDMGLLYEMGQKLEAQGWDVVKSDLVYRPKNPVDLGSEQESDVREFLQRLEDHDDVKRVHLAV